ncbi:MULTISPECIES: DUF4369 domain-containing protein [Arenibacter]|uniref:DUF4369 domain-containing protein n=1 Tax=Arenibacter TaxID=178469 RepID=UPI001C07C524|nr:MULTISPECIES: DUF4369 domain-containing protein [Arenibacter]MBU2904511.1 DUF4369 domain-containing protein [Arenibacter algicola]MCK0137070.1 DUF4369 domain-containing protein [Arenibacter sp. S6351L]
MKKILMVAVLAIIISSCGGGSTENTMTVTGNVKGLKKGTLYLQHIADTTLVTVDSLVVDGDGNFSFTTELESPELFYLYLDKKDNNSINDRITFFGEPGTITINTNWNTFDLNAKIEGSKSNEKLKEYLEVMSKFNTKNLEYARLSMDPNTQSDSVAFDSLQDLTEKNVKRGYLYAINFALNNADSYVAPYIAVKEVSDANLKYLDSINNTLSVDVANSKYGKELKEHIENLRKETKE